MLFLYYKWIKTDGTFLFLFFLVFLLNSIQYINSKNSQFNFLIILKFKLNYVKIILIWYNWLNEFKNNLNV
jgi:hypothetical protein